jgi:hypothetical protein
MAGVKRAADPLESLDERPAKCKRCEEVDATPRPCLFLTTDEDMGTVPRMYLLTLSNTEKGRRLRELIEKDYAEDAAITQRKVKDKKNTEDSLYFNQTVIALDVLCSLTQRGNSIDMNEAKLALRAGHLAPEVSEWDISDFGTWKDVDGAFSELIRNVDVFPYSSWC